MIMNNSLASMRPELVREWSDKNLPLTPDKITYGSNKIVWWKAACGHEWQTSVKARSKGENCPICSGARVIEGINDLATLKPELAQEWSEKNHPLSIFYPKFNVEFSISTERLLNIVFLCGNIRGRKRV